jgi:hypothetical protein
MCVCVCVWREREQRSFSKHESPTGIILVGVVSRQRHDTTDGSGNADPIVGVTSVPRG